MLYHVMRLKETCLGYLGQVLCANPIKKSLAQFNCLLVNSEEFSSRENLNGSGEIVGRDKFFIQKRRRG